MKKLLVLAYVLALAVAVAHASPGRFGAGSNRVTNAWFPLLPGSTWVYRGIKDGKPAHDVVTVPRAVKTIDGVRCQIVEDRLYLAGRLAERTTDWYAQDRAGNVWYYGEQTAELDSRGNVTSTEGTWQAGRDGAQAGIFMPADPRVGQSFRQEHYRGHAEDHFRVLARTKSTLLTREWTPLEPGVVDHKRYRRGVGEVREESVRGPTERLVLVSFRGPRP
jgi:hypothetical protein